MMIAGINYVTFVAYAMMALLSVTAFLALIRLFRGPSLPDRVIALDLIATLMVGLIAVYAVAVEQPVLLRIAMVVALINFIGTVAFAFYLKLRRSE
ncbi:MAG: monovalent cation/H+ antiporter complex subunit F [Acidobacteriota bacterium]|jgi:multicomponent Na+:H+ antiporter subunit F